MKKGALTTAGALVAPYILPSGRLFAPSGSRSAEHVVLVMFAGGVRYQDSLGKGYLAQSQVGEPYEGNIMYNMLTGAAPTMKIVYGTGEGGINPIPPILSTTLQEQGKLFTDVKALYAGHYGGLNSILQGIRADGQGLKQRPTNPTIFEYLRRHAGLAATDTWFVGNGIDGSVPLLNYSANPDYGIKYGANFLAPSITFNDTSFQHLGHGKIYHPENELSPMYKLKAFLDNTFAQYGGSAAALGNTEEEKQQIKEFMNLMYEKVQNGTINLPPVTDNGDAINVGFACELLEYFEPSFLCLNLNAVDVCHGNYTGYVSALHRADHAIGHLWNMIQSHPTLAGNTNMICIPECGRNLEFNTILDQNDWASFDHSDENSLDIWALGVGPGFSPNTVVDGTNAQLVTNAMFTVADIFGISNVLVPNINIQANTTTFLG